MSSHPYDALMPDVVLDALSSVGLHGDGRLMALSSYENRVYQIHLEDGSAVVAKFYRPDRWTLCWPIIWSNSWPIVWSKFGTQFRSNERSNRWTFSRSVCRPHGRSY